jgi:two-component system response regulator
MTNRSILLVEDNPNDEELTLRALQKSGITERITVAHDGREALAILLGRAATGHLLPGLSCST